MHGPEPFPLKLLALLALLPLFGPLVPEADSTSATQTDLAPTTVVRARKGRVSLLTGKTLEHLTKSLGPREVKGIALVETGPSGAAEVAWRGWGSLGLEGRSSVGFEVVQRKKGEPFVHVELRHLRRVDVEARRSDFFVDLPGGYVLELRSAVVEIRQGASGRLDLFHRGGRPVRVFRHEGSQKHSERRLESGQRLRLETTPRQDRP